MALIRVTSSSQSHSGMLLYLSGIAHDIKLKETTTMKITKIIMILGFTILPFINQANAAPEEFRQEILDTHNDFRVLHDSPELQWDNTLAEYAQATLASVNLNTPMDLMGKI